MVFRGREPVKYFKENASWLKLIQQRCGNFCSQALQLSRGMVLASSVTDEALAQIPLARGGCVTAVPKGLHLGSHIQNSWYFQSS